jgi:acyl carrier protein
MVTQGMQAEIETKIMSFIRETFPRAREQALSNTDSLLDNRIIDSMDILDLVAFIETEFEITVDGEDLLPENFQTIASLAAFVKTKLELH